MNDINNRKFIAAGLLFALWTGLVCSGHADPGLIDAIKWTLSALGAFHAVSNLQAAAAAPLAPPPAPPAQIPPEVIVAQVAAALAQHQSQPVAPTFQPAPKEPA